jgi:hypothetical protein
VQRTSESSDLIKQLVESGDLYHPLAMLLEFFASFDMTSAADPAVNEKGKAGGN